MLALSLLLSAAAGVNAILGGEVKAVQISDREFICADDCVYKGGYFAQPGYWCPEEQIIARVDANGNGHKRFPFDCTGAKMPKGWVERPLRDGDEPRKCDVFESTATDPNLCLSNRSGGKTGTKIVQWSEVEKELKSAAASQESELGDQGKAQPPKPQETALSPSQLREKIEEKANEACNFRGILETACRRVKAECIFRASKADPKHTPEQIAQCVRDQPSEFS